MHVDVNVAARDCERQVDLKGSEAGAAVIATRRTSITLLLFNAHPGVRTARERLRKGGFDRAPQRARLDQSVVHKQNEGRLLAGVRRARDEAVRSESEIRHAEEPCIRAARRRYGRAIGFGHVTVFEIEFDQILLERGTVPASADATGCRSVLEQACTTCGGTTLCTHTSRITLRRDAAAAAVT